MARRARKDTPPLPGLFDSPAIPASADPTQRPSAAKPKRAARDGARDETREPSDDAGPVPATAAPEPSETNQGEARLSVAQLTSLIQAHLGKVGRVAVEGELSGLKRYSSGHVYFDLKDEGARISCVIWRSRVERALRFEPEDGMQLVARGKLDVYAPRGSYSLIVDSLEPLGLGLLLAELERLKGELRGLGWFERQRPLPRVPRVIGLVASRDSAALRDFLRTRSLRWPGFPVRLCHSAVQGPGAALEVADAIARLDASGVDVIAVCRGGGSLEDLWAFNERPVAQAIRAARVPVVTGIGHESDTTLADLVADHRAHTPTDAAQTLIPDARELWAGFERLGNFLEEAMDAQLRRRAERLSELALRPSLRSPHWILGARAAELEGRRTRLLRAAEGHLERRARPLGALQVRLERQSPAMRLQRQSARLAALAKGLQQSETRLRERAGERLSSLARALEGVSPLRVLARGYALVRRAGEAGALTDAGQTRVGETIEARLARGSLRATVTEVESAGDEARAAEDGGNEARP